MSRIVHFELPSTNPPASRQFYENVFGWKINKWEGPDEYWLVSTGDPSQPGIDGAIGGAAESVKGTVNTVEVADIDQAIRNVKDNGGEIIMEKAEIPGMGWVAYFREPGGAVLGLFQGMPGAQM